MPNRPTLLALAILSLTPCFSTLAQANSLDGVPALESLNQLGELHLSLPNIQTFQTDNGIDVLFTPLHELPIVDVTLSFDAGASHDGLIDANAQGIANMAATLLTKGTKNLSEDEFIAKKESLGIELAAGADKDFVTMSLRSLSNKNTLKSASELMVLALTEPAF
ncbi:MAG: insulinase family protein, partial [Moraxella sp.]|nr:insulinase family protein [Moraxella sp.]